MKTRREIMLNTLSNRSVDVVPQQVVFHDINALKLVAKRRHRSVLSDILEWLELLDDFMVDVTPVHLHESSWLKEVETLSRIELEHSCTGGGVLRTQVIDETAEHLIFQFENGARWRINKRPFRRDYVDYPIKNRRDLLNYRFPDPDEQWRYEGVAEEAAYFRKKGYFTSAEIHGFFSGVWYRYTDLYTLLISLKKDRGFARDLIDSVGEFNLRSAEHLLESGIDSILFCDDLGHKTGMLISPEDYERFIYPWHKRIANLCHQYGSYCHLHSHGHINDLIPLLIDAGIDILNPVDYKEGLDIEGLKASYGDKLTFYVETDLPVAERGQVDAKALNRLKKIAEIGRQEGGIILRLRGIFETTAEEALRDSLSVSAKLRRGEN